MREREGERERERATNIVVLCHWPVARFETFQMRKKSLKFRFSSK